MIKCCLNCPDRQLGCHSQCKLYKDEKAEWDERRREEKKRRRQEYLRMKAIAAAQYRMSRGRK